MSDIFAKVAEKLGMRVLQSLGAMLVTLRYLTSDE